MPTTKIPRTIERYQMLRRGERVLVGLSGGRDSVLLTYALHRLRDDLGIELVAAHFNHGLRLEAAEDEAFCRRFASELDIPFVAGRADVALGAMTAKRSIEDAARRARYAFLQEQARAQGCSRIAVGHTKDDQAETLLMRFARGSGARGLAGVHPVLRTGAIDIVRPLIEVRRDEVTAFLDSRHIRYREDASNLDRRFTRNRIRHDVLPVVRDALNPNLVNTLARSAVVLRDEDDFMDAEARRFFAGSARAGAEQARLSVAALAALHPAIRRRLIRLSVEHAVGGTDDLTLGHVDAVLSLLEDGRSGREVHIPGAVAERSFDELVVTARHVRVANGYNEFEYRLRIPAELRIAECQGLLTAHLVESVRAGDEPGAAAGNAVVVGVEDGLTELRVRSPRPSDRFRPLGAPGSKPLARYLMERKVAKRDRRRVPLVLCADREEILWVCGHAVSETARLGTGRLSLRLKWMDHE